MKKIIEKLQVFMEEKLLPIGIKISNQRHLGAIRNGMAFLIPITIIGGFSCLLASPPVPAGVTEGSNPLYAFLLAWQSFANANSSALWVPYFMTTSILSVYTLLAVAYNLAKSYNLEPLSNSFGSLLIFLIVSRAFDLKTGAISTGMLGASYMFGAIVIAIVTVEVVRLFNKHNIVIHLPEAVPPNVAAPFNVILPLVFNVVVFTLLNNLCISLSGGGITELVFTILTPLITASDTFIFVLFVTVLSLLFWFFGIHGDNLVGAVTGPIITANLAINTDLYAKGLPASKIYAGAVASVFAGWLIYNVLQFLMAFFCKSERLKSLVKVSVVPSLFNINEPCVFGIPTVLNIYLFIGTLIASVVNLSIYWFCASMNIIGKFIINIPWSTPGIFQAFLSTLDFKAVILWIVLFALDVVILLPFMKTYDKQLLQEEAAANK